jgi:MFS family permease
MAGIGSWFGSAGAQGTLFPWLVAVELGEPAFRVGTAQTLAMLPALFLLLVGGVIADRRDCRDILIRLHTLAVLPPVALAFALYQGHRSYAAIVAYAVAMGAISAFTIPARDSLLSRVVGSNVQRTVTTSILVQTISQIGGTLLGGTAAALGAPWVLLIQAAVLASGAVMSARLLAAPPSPGGAETGGRLREIQAGLAEIAGSPRLLPVNLLAVAIGLCFLGSFLVAVPLLVRDVYGGSAPEIAGVNGSMMIGMFAGAGVLLARGGVRRQGRALLLSLITGAIALISLSFELPLAAVYGVIFLFGSAGGIAMPSGRTLIQEAAPESHRARILSVYSLGFMGAAPLGAFGMGVLAEQLGPLAAISVPGAVMLAATTLTILLTDTWRFEGPTSA